MRDETDRRIINGLQGGFPIEAQPFVALAPQFCISEEELIERIDRLCRDGWLSRFGPMYDAERLGGNVCLAALAVPAADFERVAAQVNAHPEIAHNYQREHP
ncbi:MAG: Lrp/AsnC family transcriptional regulator [Rhodospirillales bacterium]